MLCSSFRSSFSRSTESAGAFVTLPRLCFMNRVTSLFFVLIVATGLAAGCERASSKPSLSPSSEQSTEAEQSEDTTLWDWNIIDGLNVSFTVPDGYWVYRTSRDAYWMVKGETPAAGSPDPFDTALANRVAILAPAFWESKSFPSWQAFEVAMGQFDCIEGDSEETAIICLDAPKNSIEGKTDAGDPYRRFDLSAVKKKSRASVGARSYIMWRRGNEGEYGVLARILDASAEADILSLVKSMKTELAP